MKKAISLMLSLVLMLSFAFNAAAADYTKMVTAQKTVAYERSSVKSEKMVTLKEGYKFTPIGSTKSYWKIEFKKNSEKYVGYVLKEHVETYTTAESKGATSSESTAKETKKDKKLRVSGIHKDKSGNIVTKLTDMNDFTVFWGNTGNKVHISPICKTFKNGTLFGSLSNAIEAEHTEGWCGVCSKWWSDSRLKEEGNPYVKRVKK